MVEATTRTLLRMIALGLFGVVVSAQAQTMGQSSLRSTVTSSSTATSTRTGPQVGQRLQIEVFVNSDIMVGNPIGQDYDAQIHRVDAIRMLELELERGLPKTEQEAAPVLRARIKAMGAQFALRTRQGAAALSAANSYGLRTVPAIVFNGKAIVYGATDVAMAMRIYAAGRAEPITARRPNPVEWSATDAQRRQR